MGGGVDQLQLLDGDLGVDLGRREFGMAEQLLDKADVGATFQHEGGAGVAEQVAGAAFADLGGVDVIADELSEPVGREQLEQVGQKQRAAVWFSDQAGPHFLEVTPYPGQRPFANRDHPVLAAFALAHHQRATLVIEIDGLQRGQFAAPHPGRVEGFQHGPVPYPKRIGKVAPGHDRLDFGDVEDVLGQAFLGARQVDLARRVVEDAVLPRRPFEERPHRDQPRMHRAAAHRQAVAFAIMEQVALVALQDGLGDFHRVMQAAFLRPLDEVTHVGAPVLHGLGRVVLHAHPFQERLAHGVPAVRVARIADRRTRAMTAFTRHWLSPPVACFRCFCGPSPPKPHSCLVWRRFARMYHPCPTPEPGAYLGCPGGCFACPGCHHRRRCRRFLSV